MAILMSRSETTCSFSAGQADFNCTGKISYNLDVESLVAETIIRDQGVVGPDGALLVNSRVQSEGIIRFSRTELSQNMVQWERLNAISGVEFDHLLRRVTDHIGKRDLFVQDMKVGADPRHNISFRVVSERAWHSLAAQHLFAMEPVGHEFVEEFTVLDCPSLAPNANDPVIQDAWEIVISLSRRLILVIGCDSAEGMRRGILKVMAHYLSEGGIVPIKAAVSQPPTAATRPIVLVGDLASGAAGLPMNHDGLPLHSTLMGWSQDGLFPIQAGVSMRLADLMSNDQPNLPEAIRRFGMILVNAPLCPDSLELDTSALSGLLQDAIAIFPDPSNISRTRVQPQNLVIVVADALGVLPPAARLTSEQAALYVLNGYKADTDSDGRTTPVFHPAYGTPLRTSSMQQHMLRLTQHFENVGIDCWLLNAGLAFGPFPDGMPMPPRVLSFAFDAIASGELEHVRFRRDLLLGLSIPYEIRGVPSLLMTPKYTWPDRKIYEREAVRLTELLAENFLSMTLVGTSHDGNADLSNNQRNRL